MHWSRLRRRLDGQPNFRRQHPMQPYILDFHCADARLAVEIDGARRGEESQIAHDIGRDRWLAERGITVFRIPASSVFQDLDRVADGVRVKAAALAAERGAGEDHAPSTIRSPADGPPPPFPRGRQP
ncbi:MAG: endonuclease domain-containing protein [Phenylobacterium sp.]